MLGVSSAKSGKLDFKKHLLGWKRDETSSINVCQVQENVQSQSSDLKKYS